MLAVATLCVAASITHLVSVEVIEGFVSPVRLWTNVAVMPIEAAINVAVEVGGPWNQGPDPMNTPPLNHSGQYGAQLYGANS
jgi:hypothetical protein